MGNYGMNRRTFLLSSVAVAPARRRDDTGPVEFNESFEPHRAALILCDMWDRHWCRGANPRVEQIIQRAAPLLKKARAKGVLIIHAPSDTMDFYQDAPQRRAIQSMPKQPTPPLLERADPPLPIDDSDGGCDTPGDKPYKAWSRQHPGIVIAPNDLISDKGDQVFSALKLRGITHLFVMGVHTNMCILNRTFAIKQMTRWGVRCVLIRDLTDAMYDPQDPPHVSHARGTELVIEYIERHWCPSTTSQALLHSLGR